MQYHSNSKRTTEVNVKCEMIKFLEDNRGKNLDDLEFGNDCLETTPKALRKN